MLGDEFEEVLGWWDVLHACLFAQRSHNVGCCGVCHIHGRELEGVACKDKGLHDTKLVHGKWQFFDAVVVEVECAQSNHLQWTK